MDTEGFLEALAHVCNAGRNVPEFLTIKEACAVAKVTRWTIQRWIKRDFIRATKLGKSKNSPVRIYTESLLAFLDSNAINRKEGEA